jgi:hypothetical protein
MNKDMNIKILEDVMPVGAPWGGSESFVFPTCFASLVQSVKKVKNDTEEDKRKLHGRLNCEYLAASGIGFSYVFDKDFLNYKLPDLTHSDKIPVAYYNTDLMLHYSTDQYIQFSMKYAGFNYNIINKDVNNKNDLWNAIKSSIDNQIPVLAETLVGTLWSIITGYDEENDKLIGWFPVGVYASPEMMIGEYPPDGYLDNGMFYKAKWFDTLSKVVIVEGKTETNYSSNEFIEYWISIMEKKQKDKLLFGGDAYNAMIELLLDDEFYQTIDDQTLNKVYAYIHGCECIAEARCFISGLTKYGNKIGEMLDVNGHAKEIRKSLNDIHSNVWKVWAVMGENGSECIEDFSKIGQGASMRAGNNACRPELYAHKLRSPKIRKEIAKYYKLFQKSDNTVLEILKNALISK